jgi:zinc transport system substrate-binding protein
VRRRVAASIIACAFASSCARSPETATATDAEAKTPVVYAMTYPLTYFAERIAGSNVEVTCPVPAEQDPQFWSPDRDTIRSLQRADLIVMNGAQMEKWALRTVLPITRTVFAAAPLVDDYIVLENAITHSHGPKGKHSHEGVDGYIWPDPQSAAAMAREVGRALVRLMPEHRDELEANLRALVRDLNALDKELTAVSAGYDGSVILTSHPFYNYVARRYGWKIHSLLLEPDAVPSDSAFVSLKTVVDKTKARHLIWEAEPPPDVTERVKRELGLTSVVFRHLATLEEAERQAGVDYLSVMKQNIQNIRPVFGARE